MTTPLGGKDVTFSMYYRPIWDWCCSIMANPQLVSQFHWNAQHNYKYTGGSFERFIDEPWTADGWWDLQVSFMLSLQIKQQ